MANYLNPLIKGFDLAFNKLTGNGYKHDHSIVFNDFLSVAISNFSLEPNPELKDYMYSRYEETGIQDMSSLFREFILATQSATKEDNQWFDLVGNYYEFIASNYKRSAFGQFFTPDHIVDMMCMMNTFDASEQKIYTVNDPACGSGRFLIASHIQAKGMVFCIGEDLDPVCAKMSVLNCLIHGVEAEIIQHNSLLPESFEKGWHVNINSRFTGIPSVKSISKEDSFLINMWEAKKEETRKEYEQKVNSMEMSYQPRVEKFGGYQMSMF